MANQNSFQFNRQVLDCVVGGVSALDIPRLNVQTEDEARQFILAYGYDLENPDHRDQLGSTYRRAVALIREHLLEEGETIPERLYDPNRKLELSELMIIASSRKPEERQLQKWACAILRVMHVYVHLRNDLFSAFRDEIQGQILKPIQEAIASNENGESIVLGSMRPGGDIQLTKFEVKPFKTTASSVVKLLARPERVALTLLDKLGVRFVTRSIYDSFRVVRFLIENHLVSFPHIIPDQSSNTLFPLNLFMEAIEELKLRESKGEALPPEKIDQILKGRLEANRSRAEFNENDNQFSTPDHRFIKFISRKLITVSVGIGENQRPFKFFYPYEFQILDQDSYAATLSGPTAHNEYKKRQRRKARERVLGGKIN